MILLNACVCSALAVVAALWTAEPGEVTPRAGVEQATCITTDSSVHWRCDPTSLTGGFIWTCGHTTSAGEIVPWTCEGKRPPATIITKTKEYDI